MRDAVTLVKWQPTRRSARFQWDRDPNLISLTEMLLHQR